MYVFTKGKRNKKKPKTAKMRLENCKIMGFYFKQTSMFL